MKREHPVVRWDSGGPARPDDPTTADFEFGIARFKHTDGREYVRMNFRRGSLEMWAVKTVGNARSLAQGIIDFLDGHIPPPVPIPPKDL